MVSGTKENVFCYFTIAEKQSQNNVFQPDVNFGPPTTLEGLLCVSLFSFPTFFFSLVGVKVAMCVYMCLGVRVCRDGLLFLSLFLARSLSLSRARARSLSLVSLPPLSLSSLSLSL